MYKMFEKVKTHSFYIPPGTLYSNTWNMNRSQRPVLCLFHYRGGGGRLDRKKMSNMFVFPRERMWYPAQKGLFPAQILAANTNYMKDFLNTTNTVPKKKKTARRARLWVFWQLYWFKINQVLTCRLGSSLKSGSFTCIFLSKMISLQKIYWNF